MLVAMSLSARHQGLKRGVIRHVVARATTREITLSCEQWVRAEGLHALASAENQNALPPAPCCSSSRDVLHVERSANEVRLVLVAMSSTWLPGRPPERSPPNQQRRQAA